MAVCADQGVRDQISCASCDYARHSFFLAFLTLTRLRQQLGFHAMVTLLIHPFIKLRLQSGLNFCNVRRLPPGLQTPAGRFPGHKVRLQDA